MSASEHTPSESANNDDQDEDEEEEEAVAAAAMRAKVLIHCTPMPAGRQTV